MRPLTLTRPKQLIEMAGRPLLEHIFRQLPDAIDEVILVIGYRGEQIQDYFGEEFQGKKITYVWQTKKTGTWRALQLARPFLGNGKFLCSLGDDILDRESIKKCLSHNLAILVKEVEDPRRFGVVVVGENNKVLDFVEKPEEPLSKLASTGLMVLDERIFNYSAEAHRDGEYYIPVAVAKMAKDHDIFVEHARMWLTTSTPEDIPKVEERLHGILQLRNEDNKTFSRK